MTMRGQGHDSNMLGPNISKDAV